MIFDTGLTKAAHSKIPYTKKEMKQLMECNDPVSGPLYFISNYFRIQHPTKGSMIIDPYDFQLDLIDSYHNNRYQISLISRQMGKSTIAAAYLLWYAMFVPDSMILIVSNKHDGAKEIMHRIRYAYESCPDHIRSGVPGYNKNSIEFDNGSRIIAQATTENSGRGLSISLVYCDELAFVPHRVAKEFWTALSPTLATGGKCIITSTPNTETDTFADIWNKANQCVGPDGIETDTGINGFKAYFAAWTDHPDRDDAWAAAEEEKIGTERFKREHLCEFITFEETLVNATFMSAMPIEQPLYVEGAIRWYNNPIEGMDYVIALDPSMGTGGDWAAIQVIELPSMEQIGEWQHKRTLIEKQVGVMKSIAETLDEVGANEIYWSVENNSLGEAALSTIRAIGEENIPGIFVSNPRAKRKGFTTSNKNKLEACAKLKSWLESNTLKVFSAHLIAELKTFISAGPSYKAKDGNHDDLVMALILAVRVIEVISAWDDEILDAVNTYIEDDDNDTITQPMPIGIM